MNQRAQVPVEALLLIVAGVVIVTIVALYIKSAANTVVNQTTDSADVTN
jgi:uncharacterized protein (UPF0333 family)